MATVYLARDLKHDREVAVKVLRADLSAVIGTERFLTEVRIAAKLDHPHILTLIDSGSADGILYYVLPYVRGESLRAKLDRERQLSIDEAVAITTQIASALDYAHGQGVVHRDIKPENILIHHGEAVLADFGIALAVKEASNNRLTETGLSLGTPQYMSPEQATGDRSLDRRSDVYSLGAVFYEMIAGEPPVTGPSAQAMIAKLLTEKPVKLRVVRETVPVSMERATERALSKVPADRFNSAGDFAKALAVLVPERESSSNRLKFMWAAFGIALVALMGGLLWTARSRPSAQPRTVVSLRDRRQITNTGRVTQPAISADGKTIAYIVTDCESTGCRYGIEMKDVEGGSARRILEGATGLCCLQISPDRRNVLALASLNGVFGAFLASTVAGPPRRLPMEPAAFWAGGDSLLLVRGRAPANTFWILVAGLDGVPVDSIRVDGPADALNGAYAIPNSNRLIYWLARGSEVDAVIAERSGKKLSSLVFSRGSVGPSRTTANALWVQLLSQATSTSAVVRIPFDSATGALTESRDTVYTGNPTGFDVTADGGTLLVDEGAVDYAGWALSFSDALKGKFTDNKRIMRGTTGFGFGLSPDGRSMVLWREDGIQSREGSRRAILPFGGGTEVPIPGRHLSAGFIDSTTLEIKDKTQSGIRLSLMDYRTHATTAALSLPDSVVNDYERVPGYGWAWIPPGGRVIMLQQDGAPRPREIQIPKWYRRLLNMAAAPDGKSIAVKGWKAVSEDSMGIAILSPDDGHFTQIMAAFCENASVQYLEDGSLGIAIYDTPESPTFYRVLKNGSIERIGSAPRPIWGFSTNFRQAVVTTRDYHGDAWIAKVVR